MFVATQGLLLAVAWLSLAPVSTFVAVYPVGTMGVGGGLANAVLLLPGESLLAPLGPTWSYLGPPVLASVVGIAVVEHRHDDVDWPVIAAVVAALLGGEAVALVT